MPGGVFGRGGRSVDPEGEIWRTDPSTLRDVVVVYELPDPVFWVVSGDVCLGEDAGQIMAVDDWQPANLVVLVLMASSIESSAPTVT
jgi:hypothetical protein